MRRVLLAVFALAAVVSLGAVPGPVSAHAELAGSDPAAGSVVPAPVSTITLTFTEGVEPAADGFLVTLPDASVVTPAYATTDGAVYQLTLDAPVTSGAVSVGYQVVSSDGHPIDGGFSFEVAAPPATTAATATVPEATLIAAPATPPEATVGTATPVATAPLVATAPPSPPATSVADDEADDEADDDGSNAVLWIVIVVAGAALVGGLGWAAAKRR